MSHRPRGQYKSKMQGIKEAAVRPADKGWLRAEPTKTDKEAPSTCPMIPDAHTHAYTHALLLLA